MSKDDYRYDDIEQHKSGTEWKLKTPTGKMWVNSGIQNGRLEKSSASNQKCQFFGNI